MPMRVGFSLSRRAVMSKKKEGICPLQCFLLALGARFELAERNPVRRFSKPLL